MLGRFALATRGRAGGIAALAQHQLLQQQARRQAGPAAAATVAARRSFSGVIGGAPLRAAAAAAARPNQEQRRGLFIQTEETPNPASLKFMPGQAVLPEEFGTSMDFRAGDNSSNSPLAKALLRVQGVTGVFLGGDFITVSKGESLTWAQLKPEIFGVVMDFYASGNDAVTGPLVEKQDEYAEDQSEIVMLIQELLEERIRPMVQEDGGDIFFKGFDEETGIVRVKLAGSCSGCPSSSVTLKSGVENMLMHYLNEVTAVVAVGEMDDDPNQRKLSFDYTTSAHNM